MFYDKVLDDGAKLVPQNSDFKVSLGCQKRSSRSKNFVKMSQNIGIAMKSAVF